METHEVLSRLVLVRHWKEKTRRAPEKSIKVHRAKDAMHTVACRVRRREPGAYRGKEWNAQYVPALRSRLQAANQLTHGLVDPDSIRKVVPAEVVEHPGAVSLHVNWAILRYGTAYTGELQFQARSC